MMRKNRPGQSPRLLGALRAQDGRLVEASGFILRGSLTTLEERMNTFYEHHQDSIRFAYRCFDRMLLNGLIQPFQQPERVVGFFGTYRNQYPVSRDLLRDIADQFHHSVQNRSARWGVPILDAPPKDRDKFVEPYFRQAKPDRVVAMLKAREPARILIAIG